MKKALNFVTSLLWKAFFILVMLVVSLLLPFQYLSRLFVSKRRQRHNAWRVARAWGRVTFLSTGSKLKVTGLENIPADGSICFMGNHQSYFDIPVLLGFMGRPLGFIAMQELAKVPVLNVWMKELPSFFLDRENARQALTIFKEAAQVMKEGLPMLIFPEGRRATDGKVGDFQLGSLKLAQMADATIVPFALDGTRKMYEFDGNIHRNKVILTVFPPITPQDPIYQDKEALAEHLRSTIQAHLQKPSL
ncbi:MAG: lysophospholipid acyltransferase family protein [Candidatus Cloacimonadaceae bacterium]|jgi:1-acyl-sn-glycerol-3-phosphate acyltransferase|nr:1-acyl-sn-glycerol-3-phosphate acyltransferase [Candidatus Cloacimonadota bacterium]MDX9949082.1 lysophospholipid acyltransferase family protein [Candidatus Syntrophosphaera sp.]